MHESFGARLRRHREEQQIALSTIAEQTRIKLSLLEDLERDDLSHWPAGIFRRAFVRSYANAANLDPETTVREFAEAHPSPVDVASAAAIAAAIEREGANGKTTSRFRSLMGSLGFARSPVAEEPVPVPVPQSPYAASPARMNGSASAHLDADRRPSAPSISLQEPVMEPEFGLPDELVPALSMADERSSDVAFEAVLQLEAAAPVEPVQMAEPLPPPVKEPVVSEPDFMAFAHLCTEFARVDRADDVPRLLREVARMMEASGLIVWVWDGVEKELRPAMTHGYSKRVVAQLPGVGREDDNATAAAFRSGQPCVINGGDQSSAALVLPLMAPGGSAGVLAIELQQGRRLTKPVRAVATIFAALMAQLVGGAADEGTMDHDVSIDHPLAALNG